MTENQWTVSRSAAGEALIEFLSRTLAVSRRRAKGLLDDRVVFVNDRRVWMARHALKAGDRIQLSRPTAPASSPVAAVRLLYRDDLLVVADKPAGIVSNGPDSVETALRRILGWPDLVAVHRLDRDTTGCLVFARDRDLKDRLVQVFRDQAVVKVYRAIVLGAPTPRDGVFTQPLDGKQARTEYRVVSSGAAAAQIRIRIATGRTHQIRRHFADAGHPVAGDPVYATAAIRDPLLKALPRQMLHAESIRLPHPSGGSLVEGKAPLPGDFRQALKRLGL